MRNNARVINEPFSTIPHSHQSLDGRYPRKYVHKKLFTQESSSTHADHSNRAISNISKNINSVLGKHASLMPDVSRSEHFINPHAEGKDNISSVFSNKFMNKESEGHLRGLKEGSPELLAKRSVQILIGLQKGGINKTQYSKINRRKDELFKRNVVPYKWDKSDAQIQHLEDISDEMLLEKYRELVIKKDGLKPFNLINKLYQIEALTSKECVVAIPRDVIKVVATNCGQSRKNSDIEHKINRIIHKPTEAKAVKEMLAWHSDKGLLTETSAMDGQHSSIAKKPPSQEMRRASRATGFPVKSLKRETEGDFGDKS